jgi:hypothetical protein
VVRPGSTSSKPSAYILDTGQLPRSRRSRARRSRQEDRHRRACRYRDRRDLVRPGEERRVGPAAHRTYTDPARYKVEGELIWDCSFGRPRRDVLPAGWYLTNCSILARVSQPTALHPVDFWNDRLDEIRCCSLPTPHAIAAAFLQSSSSTTPRSGDSADAECLPLMAHALADLAREMTPLRIVMRPEGFPG